MTGLRPRSTTSAPRRRGRPHRRPMRARHANAARGAGWLRASGSRPVGSGLPEGASIEGDLPSYRRGTGFAKGQARTRHAPSIHLRRGPAACTGRPRAPAIWPVATAARKRRPSATRRSSPPKRGSACSSGSPRSARRSRISCSPAVTLSSATICSSSWRSRGAWGSGSRSRRARHRCSPRTRSALIKAAGVDAISLSLDGHDAAHHDAIRGIAGTYERTLTAARIAREVSLPFQVNTLVCEETIDGLPAIHEQVVEMGAARWSLFFLVTVGRGHVLRPITPERAEQPCSSGSPASRSSEWRPGRSSLIITTTEAPQLRRVVAEELRRANAPRRPRLAPTPAPAPKRLAAIPPARPPTPTTAPGSATEMASSSSRTPARSAPRASSKSRQATSARTTSSMSIAAPLCSASCASPTRSAVGADGASTASRAAAPGRARIPPRATRSAKTPCARTSPRPCLCPSRQK